MYIRTDKDCNPNPASHTKVTDAYGNTFENWCVAFVGTDKDCAPNGKTGCAPQDPDGLIPLWEHRDVENNVRPLSPYIDSPLYPTIFINDTIDDIIDDGATPVLVLGLSQDRDMVVFNENQIQYIQLEDNTTLMPGVVYS